MRVDPIQLNYNKFILDYRNQIDSLKPYFEYNPFESFTKRLDYIDEAKYKRTELVKILSKMNKHWGSDESTLKNIKRLEADDAVVVIGGQQAGLLTGPMYSINKVISIIQLAKEQEEKLKRPVIPVFWIAGEDHDFDEINHVNMRSDVGMKKRTIKHFPEYKKSISDIELDLDVTQNWLTNLFLELEETSYSKDLYSELIGNLKESQTYVDFFARIINTLFKDTGLVMVDSGHSSLRELEIEYFIKLINNQEAIAKEVFHSVRSLQEENYAISLEVNVSDGHLFYHDDHGERILLSKVNSNLWQGKNEEIEFTTDELLNIAEKSPSRLSNNVVTRPLMQEWLFPTLAFVGGYGEISYWASLKKAFKVVGLEMPPVIPRYSITYIPNKLDKLLTKNQVNVSNAINQGVNQLKLNWLSNQTSAPIEWLVSEMNKSIEELHRPLKKIAAELGSDIEQLAETNLTKMLNTTEFLEKRLLREVENKYDKQINEYNLINDFLYPDNGLQERIWNPLFMINEYGVHVIKELIKLPLSFTEDHFIVRL